jgi:nucleoside-diphosphate-sugar epimerase
MKILFTGGSSFTGFWFVQELIKQGHHVTTLFRNRPENYQGTRKKRIDILLPHTESVFEVSFGDASFLQLLYNTQWDVLCHHAADVTGYKSPDFNYLKAVENNTLNVKQVVESLSKNGIRLILTGSVFEQNEGKGSDALRAVSPYGLSKGLSSEIFKFYCSYFQVPLTKFVIPNPFGPYEEFRYTSFLIDQWFAHQNAAVKYPDYIRDNIHVSLLAKAYTATVKQKQSHTYIQTNPSGYVGSQAAFTEKFAHEMRHRLSIPCEYTLFPQADFHEPKERTNTESLDSKKLGWDEMKAWDELAEYYKHSRKNLP